MQIISLVEVIKQMSRYHRDLIIDANVSSYNVYRALCIQWS